MAKKRRRMMRYKRYKRYRRRTRVARAASRPEIKYLNVIQTRQSSQMSIPNAAWGAGSPSQASSAVSFALSDILGGIVMGTSSSQRIGRSIFVKSIRVKHNIDICANSASQSINSSQLRVTWCSVGGPALTAIPLWFKDPIRDRMIGQFNNTRYRLHYNKIYNLTSGFPNTGGTGAATYQGLSKTIAYTIPVNRRIQYTTTDFVKEERDIYSLFLQSCCPNGFDGLQVHCINTQAQIYFTDV